GMAENAAPAEFRAAVDRIARSGGTPLAVTENDALVGVIHLKDVVKPGVKARFADLRRMGLRTVMITGDNPVTAAAIASEARGDAGGQDAPDQGGTGQGTHGRHVRRRGQRRPGSGPG